MRRFFEELAQNMLGFLADLSKAEEEAKLNAVLRREIEDLLIKKVKLPFKSRRGLPITKNMDVDVEVPPLLAEFLDVNAFKVIKTFFNGGLTFEVSMSGRLPRYVVIEEDTPLVYLIYAALIYAELKRRGIDIFEEFRRELGKEREEMKKVIENLERLITLAQTAIC